MCEPTTIMTALAAGQSLFSQIETARATEAQWKMDAKNQDRANKAAMESYLADSTQLAHQQLQEDESTAQERLSTKLETQKRASAARAAGAESGLTGISLDAQVTDLIRGGATNLTNIDTNAEFSRQQREYQKKSLQRTADGRVGGFKVYQPSKFSSLVGAGLQIGGSAAQGYSAGKSLSK